jgi:hypothetical protein
VIKPNEGQPVEAKFASDSISVLETRVQNNLWTGLERIGIFMVENGTTNIMGGVSNREYTNPNTSSLASVTFSSSNPICYPLVTTPKVAFIAYHPYKSLTDVWTYPIDVSNQTSQSAIDLMRAAANNSGSGYDNTYSSTVNLHFSHKLSKVIINVVAGDGVSESLSGMSVRITNLPYRGSLNLSGNSNTVSRQATPVGNIAPFTVTDGSQYEAIIIPGSTAGIKLSFTTGTAEYEASIPSPVEWQSGRKYSYTVTLTRYNTEISGTVEDWDGTTPDVPTIGYPEGLSDESGSASDLYQGEIQIYYTDDPPIPVITASAPSAGAMLRSSSLYVRLKPDGELPYDHTANKVIREISLGIPGKSYLIGRHTSSGPIYLNIDKSGNLKFRPADENNNIPIGCYAEFQMISDGSYIQDADIDLMGPEQNWNPKDLYGTLDRGASFDGNGKTIDNLYVSTSGYAGLFNVIWKYAAINNVNVKNGDVRGGDNVGGLVAYAHGGSVSNSSYSGSVTGLDNVGGIVGYTSLGTDMYGGSYYTGIGRCNYSGSVTGLNDVGGIVGVGNGSRIGDCYNTGSVTGSGNHVGGISGSSHIATHSTYHIYESNSIVGCYNTGDITGNNDVGGIVGFSNSYSDRAGIYMTACYNTGNIFGIRYIGGIAGNHNGKGSVFECYNTGGIYSESDISESDIYIGGIVGHHNGDPLSVSYWLNISGDNANYGIGNLESNDNAIPFGSGESWPVQNSDLRWGIGNGGGSYRYWQSLGNWVDGNEGKGSVFPKLWWEE